MRTLIIDITNLLFRAASIHKGKVFDHDDLVGISMHTSFQSAFKHFRNIQPDRIVFTFESNWNWRKKYTENSVRDVVYKANRVKDPGMKHFFEMITAFKEVCTKHTSIICLSIPGCEADDCVAGYVQMHEQDLDHEMYIVSSDRDFTQLLRRPGIYLVNPDDGKFRNQPGDKEYYEDLDYFLFRKSIRGDLGDNVHSAYPRVRENKILNAYKNDFDRINFMNTTWKEKMDDGTEREHRVGDLYEENRILVDLTMQPADIRKTMMEEIEKTIKNPGIYSNFHFLKFLGTFKLNKLSEEIVKYTNMLACNQLGGYSAIMNNKQSKKVTSFDEAADKRKIEEQRVLEAMLGKDAPKDDLLTF